MAFVTRQKLIVIYGPTASGKSACAVKLAKRIGGEIISADSRQIYHGLNIGSGKITRREMRGVKHHCINIAQVKKTLTVKDWKECAESAIENIRRQDNIPIIVGGAGFYIDTLINTDQLPQVPPNPTLRKSLGTRATKSLFVTLQRLDPRRAKTIDKQNKRRLIRAIEITKALGKVPKRENNSRYETKMIILKPSPVTLKKRISKRVDDMIRHGLVKEAKRISKQVTRKRFAEFGFEYAIALCYANKQITKEEMRAKLKTETWRYAKRQQRWFHNKK
jgi:tRNA dimethylallyltransferase